MKVRNADLRGHNSCGPLTLSPCVRGIVNAACQNGDYVWKRICEFFSLGGHASNLGVLSHHIKSCPTMTSICHTGKSGDFSRVMLSSFCYFHDCVSWANCMRKISVVCSSLKTPWKSKSNVSAGLAYCLQGLYWKRKKAWNIEILLEFYRTRNVNSKAVGVLYMCQ